MSTNCGWKSFSRNPRRHSVIHRQHAPRSIRGHRNPESRDGRLRSVQGQMGPEYRGLKHQRRRKDFSLLKPVYMSFFIQISRGRRRSMFCFNQTSEWTTTTRQLHDKPPLARSSQAQRRSGSSKGWPCGQPIKTDSLTVVGQE